MPEAARPIRKAADPPLGQLGALIHERLSAIKTELRPVGKDQRNTQQGYAFRGIEDMLAALAPLLGRHQVYWYGRTRDVVREVRETKGGGKLWTVLVHLEVHFTTVDGSEIVADAWGEGTDSGDKASSKAYTGALKTILGQVFAFAGPAEDDPDQGGEETTPAGDPEAWYRKAGWRDRAEHDAWRAETIEAIKPRREAFSAWAKQKVVPAFAAGAHDLLQAEKINTWLAAQPEEGKSAPSCVHQWLRDNEGAWACNLCGERQ